MKLGQIICPSNILLSQVSNFGFFRPSCFVWSTFSGLYLIPYKTSTWNIMNVLISMRKSAMHKNPYLTLSKIRVIYLCCFVFWNFSRSYLRYATIFHYKTAWVYRYQWGELQYMKTISLHFNIVLELCHKSKDLHRFINKLHGAGDINSMNLFVFVRF